MARRDGLNLSLTTNVRDPLQRVLAVAGGLSHYEGSNPQQGATTMIDRSEVARALAKAIAYKNCGKDREAEEWAARLVVLLECANILHASAGGQRRAA